MKPFDGARTIQDAAAASRHERIRIAQDREVRGERKRPAKNAKQIMMVFMSHQVLLEMERVHPLLPHRVPASRHSSRKTEKW